jgi:hypothetical protein
MSNSASDKKHDQAIDMSFPASDSVAPGNPTGTEEPYRPADRKAPKITREQIEQAQRGGGHCPSSETVAVRQGTGPRATVSVLFVSLLASAAVGGLIIGYFVFAN